MPVLLAACTRPTQLIAEPSRIVKQEQETIKVLLSAWHTVIIRCINCCNNWNTYIVLALRHNVVLALGHNVFQWGWMLWTCLIYFCLLVKLLHWCVFKLTKCPLLTFNSLKSLTTLNIEALGSALLPLPTFSLLRTLSFNSSHYPVCKTIHTPFTHVKGIPYNAHALLRINTFKLPK